MKDFYESRAYVQTVRKTTIVFSWSDFTHQFSLSTEGRSLYALPPSFFHSTFSLQGKLLLSLSLQLIHNNIVEPQTIVKPWDIRKGNCYSFGKLAVVKCANLLRIEISKVEVKKISQRQSEIAKASLRRLHLRIGYDLFVSSFPSVEKTMKRKKIDRGEIIRITADCRLSPEKRPAKLIALATNIAKQL